VKNRRGQSLIESTLVLLMFFGMLLGVLDVAQVLFSHQSLVERVNTAVRWGSTHPWQGAEPIRNMVLFAHPEEPVRATEGYLGLTPGNVEVEYRPPTAEHPDDEMLTVRIVNFESHLFSPGIGRTLISPRPVMVSVPVKFAQK
jgi:hypothetical protein